MKDFTRSVIVSLHCQVAEEGLKVGAAVTLTDLRSFCQTLVQNMPEHRTRVLAAICERMSHFGGNQVHMKSCLYHTIAWGGR